MRRTADRTIRARVITLAQLVQFGACYPQRKKFKDVFGASALFNAPMVRLLYETFQFVWLSNMLEPREAALCARSHNKISQRYNRFSESLVFAQQAQREQFLVQNGALLTEKPSSWRYRWDKLIREQREALDSLNQRRKILLAVNAMRYFLAYGPRGKV